MRQAVRAIVIHNDALLIMHRNKFGLEYDTLVGGKIDPGESGEQALLREIQEETGIVVKNLRLVFIENAGDPYGMQYVYLCEYVSGEPTLAANAIESLLNQVGQNLYTPMWLPLSQLSKIPFRSDTLKVAILEALEKGFPKTPKKLSSAAEIRYTDND